MRLLLVLFLLAWTIEAPAQILVPYLGANGLYGYADETGRVAVPPAYHNPNAVFPANQLSITIQDDSRYILLLRNGLTFPASSPRGFSAVGARNYNSDLETLDTLPHLVGVYTPSSLLLSDTRTHTERTYQIQPATNSQVVRFYNGVLQVRKAYRQINFVDTNLNELFTRDFVAGKVLDARYLAVAEGDNKLAVADYQGHVLTPFVWRQVQTTTRTGFLVVNADPNKGTPTTPTAGLLNVATGQLVLDTVYNSIEALIGDEVLVVSRRGKYGLVDYTGREVVPLEYLSLDKDASKRWLLANKRVNSQIFDVSGRPQLPDGVTNVFAKSSMAGKPYLEINYRDRVEVRDVDLRLVASFTDVDEVELWQDAPLIFRSKKVSKYDLSYYLHDASGKAITQDGFREISPTLFSQYLFKVKNDSFYGLMDWRGQMLLPLNFTELRLEFTPKDTLMWGRTKGQYLWVAFDRTGRKLPQPARVVPNSASDAWVGFEYVKWGSEQRAAILPDGQRVVLPDSTNGWEVLQTARTPAGGFVIFSEDQPGANRPNLRVWGEKLQNLVPLGFWVLQKNNGDYNPQTTGLITVARNKKSRSTQAVLPPKTPPAAGQNEVLGEVRTFDEPAPKRSAVEEIQLELGFDSCGVLDARGEWVLPPKSRVRYVPLSYYLVAELPADGNFRTGERLSPPVPVHRVSQRDKGAVQVEWFSHRFFQGEQTTTQWRVVGKGLAYFDQQGRQLTPFGVVKGPFDLKSRNVVVLEEAGASKKSKTLIINQKGEALADLSKYEIAVLPHEKGNDWRLDYLVVNEQLPNAEAQRLLKMPVHEAHEEKFKMRVYQGILDSAGRVVLPLKYLKLQILAPERLVAAQDTSRDFALYNWQGQRLHTFTGRPASSKLSSLTARELVDGKWVVSDGHSTVLVGADNRVEQVYDSVFAGSPAEVQGAFFLLTTPSKQVVWVSTRSGKELRE